MTLIFTLVPQSLCSDESIDKNCADLTSEASKAGMPWFDAMWLSSLLTSPAQLEVELMISPWLVKEIKSYGTK